MRKLLSLFSIKPDYCHSNIPVGYRHRVSISLHSWYCKSEHSEYAIRFKTKNKKWTPFVLKWKTYVV